MADELPRAAEPCASLVIGRHTELQPAFTGLADTSLSQRGSAPKGWHSAATISCTKGAQIKFLVVLLQSGAPKLSSLENHCMDGSD